MNNLHKFSQSYFSHKIESPIFFPKARQPKNSPQQTSGKAEKLTRLQNAKALDVNSFRFTKYAASLIKHPSETDFQEEQCICLV